MHPLTLPGNRAAASVCYSPDGSVVAASTPDGCICVVQVGSRTAIATLRACTGSPVPPLVGFGASGVLYSVCGNRLQVRTTCAFGFATRVLHWSCVDVLPPLQDSSAVALLCLRADLLQDAQLLSPVD